MISDGTLIRDGDTVRRCQGRDANIVEGRFGGWCVVRLCECGHRRRSYPSPSGRWMCVHCGRTVR